MALRGTLTHWKTRRLAMALEIEPWMALGLLEALWHTTAEDAPAGNIGRLPDEAIVAQMFCNLDASKVIRALVASRHLEEHKTHRLIVHDWAIHADYNTKRKLVRRKENILLNDGSEVPPMTRHDSSATGHDDSEAGHDASKTGHNPPSTRHNPTPAPEPVPAPEPAPGPEPVPEPVPDLPTGVRESGAAASHPPPQEAARGDGGVAGRGTVAKGHSGRVAGQKNNAAPGTTKRSHLTKSAADRAEWARGEIRTFLADFHGGKEVGWSDRDEVALRDMLENNPSIGIEELRVCLGHRAIEVQTGYQSWSTPPSKWLRQLPASLAGPVNTFGEPIARANGQYKRRNG